MSILEACRLHGVKRMIYVSTRSIYGEYLPQDGPIGEEFVFRPVAFYGATKCAADLLARTYRKVYGYDTMAVRITGVYGPGLTYPHPLYNFLKSALDGKEVYQERGGDYLYEFTYVQDVIRGLIMLMDSPSLQHEAYNLATGKQVTLAEVGHAVAKALPGSVVKIGPGFASGAVPRAALDIRRIQEEVGFQPAYDVYTGVRLFADYLREGRYVDAEGS
jgi:nucleoside-diphosphate-sugar epimerase